MYIASETVEEVRDASEIVSIISGYVKLRKKGSGHFGLCPFHKEKTPSFSVSYRKQIFKCFGCDKSGNVFSFIMHVENVDFQEAVSILAERTNIELPESKKNKGRALDIDSLYKLNKLASHYYSNELFLPDGTGSTKAEHYLADREFIVYPDSTGKSVKGKEVLKKFHLGYAPNDPKRKWLYNKIKNKFTEHVLAMSGLFHMDTETDVFNNQIIFSVVDTRNRVVSLSGRYLDNEDVKRKYLNISKTPVYSKNNVLWGLEITKGDIKSKEFAYVVEGQFDAIRLYQNGYRNVVATMGTEVSETQAKLLSRYTKEAILIRDGDLGGVNSIKASSLRLMNEEISVRVVMLPEGYDPDKFVNEHKKDYVEEALTSGINFIEMWIKNTADDSISSPVKLSNKLRQIKSEISNKINSPLLKDLVIEEFSKAFSLKTLNLMSDEKIIENMTKEESIKKRIGQIKLKLKLLNSLDEGTMKLLEEHLKLTKELQIL